MRKAWIVAAIMALFVPVLFLGCSGDDGSPGAPGAQGPSGDPGLASLNPESCAICHNGNTARGGDAHQAAYKELYQDGVIQVAGLAYSFAGGNDIVSFTMTKSGANFDCRDADSLGIYFTTYTDNNTFEQAARRSLKPSGATVDYNGSGLCTVTSPSTDNVDLFTVNGLVVVYGRDETLGTIPNSRVQQAKFPFAALLETGPAGVDYVSAANVDGCEKCHTVPFLKHGYIYGRVNGDPATDMYTCKACHLDNGNGSHFIWQVLVTDHALAGDLYATLVASGDPDWELEDGLTPAQKALFAYKTRLMNDVHMSHAMEFAYPQSMSNCATCHDGKLNLILTDANFVGETCKSCHAVTGPGKDKQAPALVDIMPASIHGTVDQDYINTTACNACHDGTLPNAPLFSEIHTGYDKTIYADAAGTKYASSITVSIDNATLNGTDITIDISAAGSAGGFTSDNVVPAVLIGLYGYDTKDFIVNGHDRWDSNCNGKISRQDGDQPIGEYVVGEEDPLCPNPYWTLESEAPGAWTITAHLATWSGMIDNNTIKRVEIGVMPELDNGSGGLVPLNAVSRTFALATGTFDNSFFGHSIVDVGKCNACHDQLATTFHSGDRGGSITICRMCHVGLAGGSHLEMQSRSIDSYVHAIHSFQAFDIGDVKFSDPFEALEYLHHTESHFPTFGTENCLACHNANKFNVPDQSKSLPGVLSASDGRDLTGTYVPVILYDGQPRNIGDVPSYITGPATRACGACHRTHAINEDDPVSLASLFSHWKSNGYLVDPVVYETDIIEVIEYMMAYFTP